jgi:hypothetical protein
MTATPPPGGTGWAGGPPTAVGPLGALDAPPAPTDPADPADPGDPGDPADSVGRGLAPLSAPRSTAPRVKIDWFVSGSLMVV